MAGSDDVSSLSVPRSHLPFKASRAAMGLLFATVTLAVLLAISTVQNIDRAQRLMESFLLEKGETIIRSIEAGSRTSIMHHMGSGDPLHTLLAESSRQEDIVFISITDVDGSVIDQAGYPSPMAFSSTDLELMLTTGKPIGKLSQSAGRFTVSKVFQARQHLIQMQMQDKSSPEWLERLQNNRKIISIGLLTEDFDVARKQDVHHTMFMGAILFLIGSAGLYFLFLYQGMRVTRSTLADMKLYTDSVIESIPVSLLTLDAENRIVSCNRNTEELLGRTLTSIRGQGIRDTLPACAVCMSHNCNDALDHPAECLTEDGTNIPVRISCSSLVNHEGEAIGKVLIIRDMSLIRDMELQLERSRRMAALGKMAAGIAHEIRNPLGTLRGFAQFFGKQASSNTEKEYSDLMVSEVDRLNQTVSGLLQFARPREPQLQNVVLDTLFAKTFALMKADFSDKNLMFNFDPDTGIQFQADPDLLLQVLMNLLKNSINATPPGGQISLTGLEDKQMIRISVTDSGHGMISQERDKMFDPFFTTGKRGTGLGLAVSHQIIEQHHGTFEIHTIPDKGTTVTVILPKDIRAN